MRTHATAQPPSLASPDCKAGKGRTGTLLAASLVHSQGCNTAAAALDHFSHTRTYNNKGVTLPSQARYVKYYALQCAARAAAASAGPSPPSPSPAAPCPGGGGGALPEVISVLEGASRDPSALLLTVTLGLLPGWDARALVLGSTFSLQESPCGAVALAATVLSSPPPFRCGDVLLSVNAVAPTCPSHALELMRAAIAPGPALQGGAAGAAPSFCVVRLLRRPMEQLTCSPSPPTSHQQYWERVRGAIGPWLGGAEGGAGGAALTPPCPSIQLHSITLHTQRGTSSVLKALASANGGAGCSSRGGPRGGLVWVLLGGPFCRTVLGEYALVADARTGSSGAGAAPVDAADYETLEWRWQPRQTPAAAAVSAAAAAEAPQPGGGAAPSSGLVLRSFSGHAGPAPAAVALPPGAVACGDARLILTRGGTSKPLAALWFHTAFLPLPAAAARAAGCAASGAASLSAGSAGQGRDDDVPGDYSVSARAPHPTLGALLSAQGVGPSASPRLLQGGSGGLVPPLPDLTTHASFSKAALDRACKDRKDVVWGVGMHIKLHFGVRTD